MITIHDETADDDLCCASCGIAGVDDVKLTKCACKLVRYCSDECQEDHRPKHDEDCKKRAAELRDEILFKQPESTHFGDCPICILPLSHDKTKSGMYSCCSKLICRGCGYANQLRELRKNVKQTCPFCRHPMPKTNEERELLGKKRIEANDPLAMCQMGLRCCIEGDYDLELEYYTKAAELGDITAHYQLSCLYHYGDGVEKDNEKELYHLEQAAIGGHLIADIISERMSGVAVVRRGQ